jgi:predicted Zn-dependent protease
MQTHPQHTPLLYSYLKKYQDDPTSRVFAPLAEAYRKAGLPDEAIEIAREGLRVHPNFVGGRVALARALFDKQKYEEVVKELGAVVIDAPDNLVAQRLFGESCLMLGRVAEALGAYKLLLFYSPHDPDTARIVHELEGQAYERGTLVLRTDPARSDEPEASAASPELADFKEQQASAAIGSDPGLKRAAWVRKVEVLQRMLQNVERYRLAVSRT